MSRKHRENDNLATARVEWCGPLKVTARALDLDPYDKKGVRSAVPRVGMLVLKSKPWPLCKYGLTTRSSHIYNTCANKSLCIYIYI